MRHTDAMPLAHAAPATASPSDAESSPSTPDAPSPGTSPGVRERKRREMMRRVQSAALDLFDERGFDNVTVEQVAAAAGVSASTVYRHFHTKEGLVLHDELDADGLVALDVLVRRHHLVDAARSAIAELLAGQDLEGLLSLSRRRMHYCLEVPSIRGAMAAEVHHLADELAASMARSPAHADQHPGERKALVVGVLWACIAAIEDWYDEERDEPLMAAIDRALSVFRTP